MSSFFNCPHCQQLFEAEPQMFGMTCACSQCAGLFTIPAPEGHPGASSSTRESAEGGNADALFSEDARVRLLELERESRERIRILEEALEQSRTQVEAQQKAAQEAAQAAAQEATREAERVLREELTKEGRELRARAVDLEARVRELETALDGERQRAETLQARVKGAEASLQAAQQEVAVQAQQLQQAQEYRARHEQRLADARQGEAKLREDLRKASEALVAEQTSRERELEKIEQAIDKERAALERSEALANRLEAVREDSHPWTSPGPEPQHPPGWQKMEVARLEAQMEQSQRLLQDAERRASLAEEQFAELLVEWESRKRLAEAFPELSERVEEQKSALENWEKREEEWKDRESDLRDTIEARQSEIEEMRSAIRLLQQSELTPAAPVSPSEISWGRSLRSPWALPLGAGFGLALGFGVGFWDGGRSDVLKPGEDYGPKLPKGAPRLAAVNPGTKTAPEPGSPREERDGASHPAEGAASVPSNTEGPPERPQQDSAKMADSAKGIGGGDKEENPLTAAAAKVPAPESVGPNLGGDAVLPTQFLGVKFGSLVSENPSLSQWSLDKGIYHRKARLVGVEVEAAITADQESRVMKGSYVRVCPRSTDALSGFLEWAVNVQDAISAQYGDPAEVEEIKEATDAQAIVERIASGKDRYMAVWRRDAEDVSIILSIGAMNERSVVFRLDYFSSALVKAFTEKQESERLKPDEPEEAKPKPPPEAPPAPQ
jgi:hypothetical protein